MAQLRVVKRTDSKTEHLIERAMNKKPACRNEDDCQTPMWCRGKDKCQKSNVGFYRAYVEVVQGNRRMSDFMAAAGLGLTGVGVSETMTIDYKPGEEVDIARVSMAMDSMIEMSNRERTNFKILSYKVMGVIFIPNT